MYNSCIDITESDVLCHTWARLPDTILSKIGFAHVWWEFTMSTSLVLSTCTRVLF